MTLLLSKALLFNDLRICIGCINTGQVCGNKTIWQPQAPKSDTQTPPGSGWGPSRWEEDGIPFAFTLPEGGPGLSPSTILRQAQDKGSGQARGDLRLESNGGRCSK